jgi:protoporphyrinogen oxidase
MNIAIVGAGIGGLAAAWDLNRAGHSVTIFESAGYPGGLAAGFKEPEWDTSVERFYHHWFASDHDMLGLMEELGWRDRVIFHRPYTVAYYNGKFYPLDSPLKALTFPGFGGFFGMVRFGLVTVYLRYLADWRPLEKYTSHEWMSRAYGPALYKTMVEPLLEGKFGPYYKEVTMAWFWARFKARTTSLGTYQGGFQAFADQFAERLCQMGVKILYNSSIEKINPRSGGGPSLQVGGASQDFDQALVTTSPGLLAHLVPDLPPDYLSGLLSLKHMGAVVMVLSLKHKLSEEGYYWYNIPKSAGYPFLALVEHTNFVPPEHFGGQHIVYIGDYLDPGHEYFNLTQDELLERFLPHLPKFNPRFNRDWINKAWLFRATYAQPVPLVNHSKNIPAIQTPIPGLYFASMSQVYPWDRGTNFAVQIGRKAARLMLSSTH